MLRRDPLIFDLCKLNSYFWRWKCQFSLHKSQISGSPLSTQLILNYLGCHIYNNVTHKEGSTKYPIVLILEGGRAPHGVVERRLRWRNEFDLNPTRPTGTVARCQVGSACHMTPMNSDSCVNQIMLDCPISTKTCLL